MKVLHFTDIHLDVDLAAVPFQDWLGKRLLGGLNYLLRRRRRFDGADEKLRALADFSSGHGVDLVLFTGDYTTLGTEHEFARARAAVEPLMRAPLGYINVPGNHDLYMPDVVRERRFERHFGDTLAADLPELATDGPWPLVRLIGDDVAVVAINSARPNPQWWRSSGVVPESQLRGLSRALEDARVRLRFVFVMTHYGPRLPDGRPDSRHHGLVNSEALLRAIAELPSGVLVHGHIHHCYHLRVDGVRPTLFCGGSATLDGREAFWLFDVRSSATTARRGEWNGSGYDLEETVYEVETGAANRP